MRGLVIGLPLSCLLWLVIFGATRSLLATARPDTVIEAAARSDGP